MIGARSGVATLIQKEEPRAILFHCYGHSLQPAVCDTVKQVRIMSDALDATNEISKLLKYSPKRDTLKRSKKSLLLIHKGFEFCVQHDGLSRPIPYRVSLTIGYLCLN